MPSLPIELYRPIVETSDGRDLLNLALVSKVFQQEAERIIYRTISVFCDGPTDVENECLRFLRIPRCLPYIRNITLTHYSTIETLDVPSFQPRLNDLLRNVVNLLSLCIRVTPNGRFCGTLFHGCTFRLRDIRCTFELDADYAAFLESQPSLLYFTWNMRYPPGKYLLSSNAVPNLRAVTIRSLNQDNEFPPEILAGRPITHFWSTLRRHRTFALSTGPIRALHLKFIDMGVLYMIKEELPCLEHLSLLDYDHHDVTEYRAYEILPALRKLSTLEISKDIGTLSEKIDQWAYNHATKLGAVTPSLRSILIHEPVNIWYIVCERNVHTKDWTKTRIWDDHRNFWQESLDSSGFTHT